MVVFLGWQLGWCSFVRVYFVGGAVGGMWRSAVGVVSL